MGRALQSFDKSRVATSLALLGLALLLAGCGAQMRQLPLGAKNAQLNASLGGPLATAFGAVIPLPYSVIGGTYGVTDRLEVHADLHVTAAAFKFFGATPGVTWFPSLPVGRWVPSLTADALVFSDLKQTRVFPGLAATVARPLGRRWVPYAGMRHTFQTTRGPVNIPSLYAGTALRLGRAQFVGELGWLATNRDNRLNPVDYKGIAHRGALSTQLGVSLDLGRGHR